MTAGRRLTSTVGFLIFLLVAVGFSFVARRLIIRAMLAGSLTPRKAGLLYGARWLVILLACAIYVGVEPILLAILAAIAVPVLALNAYGFEWAFRRRK